MIGETVTSAPALGSTADRFAAPSQAAVAAAASAQTIVQATQLSKWYGQVSGLNDVTASIPGGHHRVCSDPTAPASRPS